MQMNYLANIGHFIPELITSLTMVGLMLVEATYKKHETGRHLLYWTSYVGLFIVMILLGLDLKNDPQIIFSGSLIIDSFSTMMKLIMAAGTLGAIYLSSNSKDLANEGRPEFVIMSVGVLVGGMLLASAGNMLTMYLGIETLSILSYAMASLRKNDDRSGEAGLKYSLYGGVSSAIMLFGMANIYGILGTTQFTGISSVIAQVTNEQLYLLVPSFLFFFVGIGYKIACVPFHMWSPDVYEGSPLPVTTFFSIVPKMAGVAVLVRVITLFFNREGVMTDSWIYLIQVIAALTMTVGNVSALGQKSVKRMLAYSSISHAGVMMMASIVLDENGTSSILFYGVAYLFMTLAAFYILSTVQDQYGNDHFERFSGLMKRHPMMAIALSIVMFSLAGIPPFSGFIAKFNILAAAISKKYYMLAIIGGVNSVVAIYYYLKVVRLMVFSEGEDSSKLEGFSFANQSLIVLFTIPIISLGICWSGLLGQVISAKLFIQ